MHVEELKVGVHLSSLEKTFVDQTIAGIRSRGYQGPIEVVGSRKEGHRISRKAMPYLQDNETHWRQKLDQLVAKNDISARDVRSKLPNLLPTNTPQKIQNIFKCTHPDSDLDLLLVNEDSGPLTIDYEDPKSGLVIEIWGRNDTSHLIESIYNF